MAQTAREIQLARRRWAVLSPRTSGSSRSRSPTRPTASGRPQHVHVGRPVHARAHERPQVLPPQTFLGALGMTGLTAWAGPTDVAALQEGDVVFISGAAGAVGSLAGQLAKVRGHTVIGSAGSPEKVAFVRDELGFDAAFSYRDGPVAESLAAAAPDGIDVYFDNVGGEHLEAAIGALRTHGRVAMCGSISGYNATEPPCAPRNLAQVVGKRLTLDGANTGKMLVRLA